MPKAFNLKIFFLIALLILTNACNTDNILLSYLGNVDEYSSTAAGGTCTSKE